MKPAPLIGATALILAAASFLMGATGPGPASQPASPASAPASAPGSQPATQPADGRVVYHVDFSAGLPEKWRRGVPTTQDLPEGSSGAVTGPVRDGKVGDIRANVAWLDGHFTIEENLYFNYRIRLLKPDWYQFFIMTKDQGPENSNNQIFMIRPPVADLKPGEWRVVSLPLRDFKATQGAASLTPGTVCWNYFWDTQGRNLGMAIDRIWVTRGPSATTQPAP